MLVREITALAIVVVLGAFWSLCVNMYVGRRCAGCRRAGEESQALINRAMQEWQALMDVAQELTGESREKILARIQDRLAARRWADGCCFARKQVCR